jgi:hypothetical protein
VPAPDELWEFLENNTHRVDAVTDRLGVYQPQSVDRARLLSWLRKFDPDDYDLAFRSLESVDFYPLPRLQPVLRSLYVDIRTTLHEDGFRPAQIVFVPAGDMAASGSEILNRFRNVNRLERTTVTFAALQQIPEILYRAQTEERQMAVVFLDDFVGTGSQIVDFWNKAVSSLIHPAQPMYCGVAVACPDGIQRIEKETPIRAIPSHLLQPRHFLLTSNQFTVAEKDRLRHYCKQIRNLALGFGKLEVLFAFAHSIPNNSLAIFRGNKGQRGWPGILPRYEDLP